MITLAEWRAKFPISFARRAVDWGSALHFVGESITISGATPSGLNGTWPVSTVTWLRNQSLKPMEGERT